MVSKGNCSPSSEGIDVSGYKKKTLVLSYARFKTRDLAESFDQYPVAK